jgi:uncharacterized hydrophobic protein (TIGR00271 family)
MQRVAFVYGEESQTLLDEIKKYTLSLDLTFLSFEAFMHQKIHFHKVLVSGNIYEIKAVFFRAISNGFEVAIIPHPNQEALRDSFALSKDIFENLQTALNNSAKAMDILYANGQIVLHIALIGDAPPLSYRLLAYHQKSFKEKIRLLFEAYQKIRFMKHTKVKIITKKQQIFETVATGIIAIEHDNKTFASKLIDNSVAENDAKLDVLIISPNSIVEYLKFIITTLFQSKASSLPASVGYIKSEQLKVESTIKMPLSIDGETVGTTPVEFIVKPQALKISLPNNFWEKENKEPSKEQIKVDKLPKSKERMSYLQKRLPLFTHAGEEQYQTLFSSLKEEGKSNSSFLILMFLSSILVTIGLYLNSASVIIGAMLLAPLMNPIVSFSMGMLRQDIQLSITSLKTITIGVLIALLTSASISGLLPFEHITQEMAGRIKPSVLDMIVAIISGFAAAYLKNSKKLSASIAGVAIAVALVPPIATAGIGLGWSDNEMFYQAFLLFLTNLIGISFAVSLLFFVQGFSPMKRAKKALFYTLIISLIISFPLLNSFISMSQDAKVISLLEHQSFEINGKRVTLQNLSLSRDNRKEVLKCELLVKKILNHQELNELKIKIEKKLKRNIELEALFRVRF